MATLFGIHPPFRIHQDPFVVNYVRMTLIDNSQGKLLQLTIFDALSYWEKFVEDPKMVLYSYDSVYRNSTAQAFFRSAQKNFYALQIHYEAGESLTYFRLKDPANPVLEIEVSVDQEGKILLSTSFQEISPQEIDRMPIDN